MRARSFTSATGLLPSRWPRCGPCYVGSDCTIAAAGRGTCRQVERKRTTSGPEAPDRESKRLQTRNDGESKRLQTRNDGESKRLQTRNDGESKRLQTRNDGESGGAPQCMQGAAAPRPLLPTPLPRQIARRDPVRLTAPDLPLAAKDCCGRSCSAIANRPLARMASKPAAMAWAPASVVIVRDAVLDRLSSQLVAIVTGGMSERRVDHERDIAGDQHVAARWAPLR